MASKATAAEWTEQGAPWQQQQSTVMGRALRAVGNRARFNTHTHTHLELVLEILPFFTLGQIRKHLHCHRVHSPTYSFHCPAQDPAKRALPQHFPRVRQLDAVWVDRERLLLPPPLNRIAKGVVRCETGRGRQRCASERRRLLSAEPSFDVRTLVPALSPRISSVRSSSKRLLMGQQSRLSVSMQPKRRCIAGKCALRGQNNIIAAVGPRSEAVTRVGNALRSWNAMGCQLEKGTTFSGKHSKEREGWGAHVRPSGATTGSSRTSWVMGHRNAPGASASIATKCNPTLHNL